MKKKGISAISAFLILSLLPVQPVLASHKPEIRIIYSTINSFAVSPHEDSNFELSFFIRSTNESQVNTLTCQIGGLATAKLARVMVSKITTDIYKLTCFIIVVRDTTKSLTPGWYSIGRLASDPSKDLGSPPIFVPDNASYRTQLSRVDGFGAKVLLDELIFSSAKELGAGGEDFAIGIPINPPNSNFSSFLPKQDEGYVLFDSRVLFEPNLKPKITLNNKNKTATYVCPESKKAKELSAKVAQSTYYVSLVELERAFVYQIKTESKQNILNYQSIQWSGRQSTFVCVYRLRFPGSTLLYFESEATKVTFPRK